MFSLTKRQAVMLGVVLLVAGWLLYQHNTDHEARLQQATVLTEEQARDIHTLENKLKISEGNAAALQAAYAREKNKPAATFYVQAPSLPAAASQVQERINSKDPTLPPTALEKTDRTVVVANETDYKVDVLKINLDKSRLGVNVLVLTGDGSEAGAGPSWKNRDNAINLGYTTKKRTYGMWVNYF